MKNENLFKLKKNINSTIVADFASFIDYIIKNGIVLTLKSQNLKQKDLYAINKLMTEPQQNVSPGNNQRSYPLLNLFYHLVLNGGLFDRAGTPSKVELVANKRLHMYQELTDYEKYFFLLETLWIDVDWEQLQTSKYNWFSLKDIYQGTKIISELEAQETYHISGTVLEQYLRNWNVFLKYFDYFGLWEIIEGKSRTTLNYNADKITPTRFGIAMADILTRERKITVWNQPFQQTLEGKIINDENISQNLDEPFYKAFVALFPEGVLEQTLPRGENEISNNIYTIKILLGRGLWHRIKIDGQHTLQDLHEIIQEAFDFYEQHLSAFFMDNKPWSGKAYYCELSQDGPWFSDVTIEELNLNIGKRFLYLYDFGDEVRLEVIVEEINEKEKDLPEPIIIDSRGD